MSIDPKEAIENAVGKFPFIMVITTILFKGSLFLTFNTPLLYLLIQTSGYSNTIALFSTGLFPLWSSAIQFGNNLVAVSLFLFLSIIIGTLFTPVERLISVVITIILEALIRVRPLIAQKYRLFDSKEMMMPEYSPVLGWLLLNPGHKSHWEWELFNYYVYWSVATNVIIFSTLTLVLIWPNIGLIDLAICFVITGIFLGFALLHSLVMYRVHEQYKEMYKLMKLKSSRK